MSNQFRKRVLQTQPQHESLSFESDSTLQNKSEAHLRPASGARGAELSRCWMQKRSVHRSNPSSPSRSSGKRPDIGFLCRKYRQGGAPTAKPQAPQLYSPSIGLKVRRAVQQDFQFHSAFTRDEVLNYFAVPVGATIRKRAARNEEELRRDGPAPRLQSKVQQLRVASKGEERLSSQLSGWKVESDCLMRQSSLDAQSCQIISNYPSINAGFTQDVSDSLPLGQQSQASQREDRLASDFELPEYSLKIVPPSELNSSQKEMISIKMIKESLPSCSLVDHSHDEATTFNQLAHHSRANVICAKTNSKMSLDPKSELKVGSCKYSVLRSKKSYDSLPSNKENHCVSKKEEQQPSAKEVKVASKGLLRGIFDSGKVSVSYSEDYVCSQKLDENDGLRVTEREETKAFKFERSSKPAPATPTAPAPPAPEVPAQVCMKKEKQRKSVVIEKIEQFGSNCKNFFSSLADKINPFRERIAEEESSEFGGSILPLRTLNSRVDLDSYNSPRDLQVRIREPTLLETQPWGVDSMQERADPMFERMVGTQHEVRSTAKDFTSEVRIALTSHSHQREEFYSQEYLRAQSEETVRQALASHPLTMQEVIAEEADRLVEDYMDLLAEKPCPRGGDRQEIKDEVALSLEMLEWQIMEDLLL